MIDLQGWMYWQATEKSSIIGKPPWKRRWVVLTPDALMIYKNEGSNLPNASYSLASFSTCLLLEPTKKSPSALSLVPNPNRPWNQATIARSTSSLIRRARRQSVPSLLPGSSSSNHSPLNSSPVVFRMEPDSPVSLHEWQRSINDRIKTLFPTESYQQLSTPPPVPKIPSEIVNMYTPAPLSNGNRTIMHPNTSHKSLSQSVTSNLSAAISSVTSVTSPSIRRMSRALSPSEMKRVKDMDQSSMSSVDATTPPATAGLQQGYLNDDSQNSLNAEKVLEQAMRRHKQRRNQQRFGVSESLKSKSSSISAKECSTPSSPTQIRASPGTQSDAMVTTARANTTTSPPNLPVASFEVLIKELEEEEEERKRKAPVTQAPKTIIQPSSSEVPATSRPRTNPPSALNEAKRRSTGSLLFTQPLTPTFPIDKESSSTLPMDRKVNVSIGGQQARRISVASFGSQQSESKRNSAHELTFNFVDWSGISGGCAVLERRANREYSTMVRSNSAFGGEFDESRRYPLAYNFGRRGSVF